MIKYFKIVQNCSKLFTKLYPRAPVVRLVIFEYWKILLTNSCLCINLRTYAQILCLLGVEVEIAPTPRVNSFENIIFLLLTCCFNFCNNFWVININEDWRITNRLKGNVKLVEKYKHWFEKIYEIFFHDCSCNKLVQLEFENLSAFIKFSWNTRATGALAHCWQGCAAVK